MSLNQQKKSNLSLPWSTNSMGFKKDFSISLYILSWYLSMKIKADKPIVLPTTGQA